tara:strand:- start:449 stop:574 length:126 start_codon:yes stop_codon:yes gene_type:complete
LGAILVQKGLAFLFTHKEIRAESDSNKSEGFIRSESLSHIK